MAERSRAEAPFTEPFLTIWPWRLIISTEAVEEMPVKEILRSEIMAFTPETARKPLIAPYINLYNNILCWYPEESDKDKIQPLTLAEIRFILRANSNYGYEIERKLESLFIKGEPVFGKFEAAEEYQYIINPRLLYRGNDPLQFKGLIDQFDVAKGQYLNKKENKKTKKKMDAR